MIEGLSEVTNRRGEAFDEAFILQFAGHLGIWIAGWQVSDQTLFAVIAMSEEEWVSVSMGNRLHSLVREGQVHCQSYKTKGLSQRLPSSGLHFAVRRVEPSELRNPFEALDEELGKMVLP